jgi:hypothetical protein
VTIFAAIAGEQCVQSVGVALLIAASIAFIAYVWTWVFPKKP